MLIGEYKCQLALDIPRGIDYLIGKMGTGLSKDIEWEKDFTVSFALLLRRDETIDFWNVVTPNNWRLIFRWGLY